MDAKWIKDKAYSWLRWSEKWTGTNMVYFSQGSFWLGINQALTMASAFILSLAFANLLPADVYGNYKYALSIISLISIPTLAGMSTALVQAVARDYEGTLLPAMRERMKWGLLSTVMSLAVAGYYFVNGNDLLTFVFLIAAVFLPLMDPLGSYANFLTGRKDFKLSARCNVATQFIILSATASTLYATDNLLVIIAVYFISRTAINAILARVIVTRLKPNDKVDNDAISYGKHLTAMNIIGWIAAQLDKILIFHYLGAVELAIYSFAMAPVDQMNSSIFNNIRTLAMPKFSESSSETLKKTLPTKVFKFTAGTIVAAAAFALLAPLAYQFVFPNYLASIGYAQFYALTLAILPLSLFNTAITAKAQKKKLYFLSVTMSCLKIIMLFTLLPFFGITGALAASMIAIIYSNIAAYILFKRI